MKRLTMILRVQAVAFAVYGLAFLFAPDFTMDGIFGWENTQTEFIRILGGMFLVLAWFDWGIAGRLEERLDLVWPLAGAAALILLVLVAVRLAGNYEGTEFFFWTSAGVAAFFAVAVGGSLAATLAWSRPGRTVLDGR